MLLQLKAYAVMDGHPVVLTPRTYLGMAQNLLTFNGHNFLTPDGHWGQIAFALLQQDPPQGKICGICNAQYLVEKELEREQTMVGIPAEGCGSEGTHCLLTSG